MPETNLILKSEGVSMSGGVRYRFFQKLLLELLCSSSIV